MDETIEPAGIVSANVANTTDVEDPLVRTWTDRVKAAEKHWRKFHQRVRHNRKLVRGIDDNAEPTSAAYNSKRANLIKSTLSVVLSKVYAKNPEMSAEAANKGKDLRMLCDTVSTVTQTMLEDAKLKSRAKRAVRAAMTTSMGIVKQQYQRDLRTDPVIRQRIEDSQDNILRINALLAQVEGDEAGRQDLESKRRELEEAVAGLQAQKEAVASEGLVVDMVRTERLLIDPAIDDIWDYEQSAFMIEKIPMRKSVALGMFRKPKAVKRALEDGTEYEAQEDAPVDLAGATTFKVGADAEPQANQVNTRTQAAGDGEDPLILVYEVWSKVDNTIYTLIDGITTHWARDPYRPQYTPQRWWPYYILPFGVVDGEIVTQSLVDDLEKLEIEHNETRDKFAEVRKNIRPHKIISADVRDKDITTRLHPELGEIIVVNTGGAPLKDNIQEGTQLTIRPEVYDTSPIRNDWEMVSGLQDAARSIVVQPKTATEASISNQSLAARVEEFRDQVEDWLTDIAQGGAELCLLAMPPELVEQIMGSPEPAPEPDPEAVAAAAMTGQPIPQAPAPEPTFAWPPERSPDVVFGLVSMKIRAGTTAAPNKLAMQESWTRALPLLREMIMVIRQIDASGGDSTPERELVKETAARFDESIDVERFLPPKPSVRKEVKGLFKVTLYDSSISG